MKKFFIGILGTLFLTGTVYAGQCFNNVCQQQVVQKVVAQPVVQYEYVQPQIQYQVVPQRVVQFVEVPKIRVVEKVREQVVVQKQLVKQHAQRVKVVQQNINYRQPILQNLSQRLQNRAQSVQRIEKIQVVNQY